MNINSELPYIVGALLYSPALNPKIGSAVLQEKLGRSYSLALCLEDTIAEDVVTQAEHQVRDTLEQIRIGASETGCFLPRIFIRVREPKQMERIMALIPEAQDLLTGFIFPKYSVSNAKEYNDTLLRVNEKARHPIWMMPILESEDIIDPLDRMEVLSGIRDAVDSVSEMVLNVRVGGNDFCSQFAVRRDCDETIYDILPVAQILADILTVFSRDYVVSGPVWEFFSGDDDSWKTGLERELRLDRLNGFVGKTVIHPKQIPVVNEMLRVPRRDYEDARTILAWDDSGLQVGKSYGGARMNEVRTHTRWAEKTLRMAEAFGVRES